MFFSNGFHRQHAYVYSIVISYKHISQSLYHYSQMVVHMSWYVTICITVLLTPHSFINPTASNLVTCLYLKVMYMECFDIFCARYINCNTGAQCVNMHMQVSFKYHCRFWCDWFSCWLAYLHSIIESRTANTFWCTELLQCTIKVMVS